MASRDSAYAESVYTMVKLIESMANFVEAVAKVEELTGTQMGDLNSVMASEEFVDFISKNLGPEGVGKVALLLIRFNNIMRANLSKASPQEKKEMAQELRKLIVDLGEFLNMIEERAHPPEGALPDAGALTDGQKHE